jgi:hypothetical protein
MDFPYSEDQFLEAQLHELDFGKPLQVSHAKKKPGVVLAPPEGNRLASALG